MLQVVHHGDKPGEVTPASFRRFLCDSPLRHAGPELYPEGEGGGGRVGVVEWSGVGVKEVEEMGRSQEKSQVRASE